MTKIYTKTGDKGETSLFTGERVKKNNPFIDALGIVDETNSTIGIAIALLPENEQIKKQLETVQHALFDVGAALATPLTRATDKKLNQTRFDDQAISQLEQWIDQMHSELPPLKNFILPGGHPSAATLHQARSICRNAERTIVPLNEHHDVSDFVLIYLNRLSDYLFAAARYVNFISNTPETTWQHH